VKKTILIVFISLIFVILITSCNTKIDKTNVANAKQIEYTVKRSDLIEVVSATGRIIPKNYMTVYPEVSGKITQTFVENGQYVKKGDPILKIDDTDYKIAYLNAKLSYEMVEGTGTLEEELKKLQYEKASKEFEETTVKAPISGYIINFSKRVGDLVSQNQALCTIMDTSKLEFDGTIDVIDFSKVKLGQQMNIEVEGNSEILQGVITYKQIANISSNNVTSLNIKADILKLGNPENLFIGASCEGEIYTVNKKNILKVPTNAVIVKDGKRYVQVKVNEDEQKNPITELREITIGEITEDFVEVVDGLKEGEVILMQSNNLIFEKLKNTSLNKKIAPVIPRLGK